MSLRLGLLVAVRIMTVVLQKQEAGSDIMSRSFGWLDVQSL